MYHSHQLAQHPMLLHSIGWGNREQAAGAAFHVVNHPFKLSGRPSPPPSRLFVKAGNPNGYQSLDDFFPLRGCNSNTPSKEKKKDLVDGESILVQGSRSSSKWVPPFLHQRVGCSVMHGRRKLGESSGLTPFFPRLPRARSRQNGACSSNNRARENAAAGVPRGLMAFLWAEQTAAAEIAKPPTSEGEEPIEAKKCC